MPEAVTRHEVGDVYHRCVRAHEEMVVGEGGRDGERERAAIGPV